MRSWIVAALAAAAGTAALLTASCGSSDKTADADAQFAACVDAAPRPLVAGPDPSVECWRQVRSDLPRCGPSATTPTGGFLATGGEVFTTDDGQGGRCAYVYPPTKHRMSEAAGAGCPNLQPILRASGLVAKRFFSRRCPALGPVRRALLDLPTGKVTLEDLTNRPGILIDLAADGVPSGPRYRQVPPLRHSPVPALSKSPTAGVCATAPSHTRLATAGIFIDTPQPRCLVVGPRQGLRIVNDTQRYGGPARPITVRFVGFHRRIRPGEAAVFRRPVGSYLAPGDHLVTSTFHRNGPEILYRR